MGVILQKDGVTAIHIENSLRITNWRYIIPEDSGISVCLSDKVFFIYDITLKDFIELASKNIKKSYKFEYKFSTLLCKNCNGRGVLDWIQKVAKEEPDKNARFHGPFETPNYIRGAMVNKITPWSDNIIYTSGPPKRLGEEYCVECHGCGVLLQQAIKSIEVVKNFGSS